MFEQFAKPGGLMRTNIPESVCRSRARRRDAGHPRHGRQSPLQHTDHQSALAARRGIRRDLRGVGARAGKKLDIPGRHDEADSHIFIGIDWLESVAFGHVTSIGSRVLIIGVGNTAMDCCRSSRRLGGTTSR